MAHILIIGSGQIGEMMAWLLATSGDYTVTLADHDQAALDRVDPGPGVTRLVIDATDVPKLTEAMKGCFAVISCAPFHITTHIADAAKAAGIHYLDLTEDVASKNHVKKIAQGADSAFLPQCGLAPGFVTIVANSLAERFDEVDTIRMRVGALPQFPNNAINYNLTWSPEGMVHEYCRPCEAIVDGELTNVAAMEGLETFQLNGVPYEAFNTSGGLGTFAETMAGKVRTMNYRSIRYPGHHHVMKAILQDLRMGERQDLFLEILKNAIPRTQQDVVVIYVTAQGMRDGTFMQESFVNHIFAQEIGGRLWTGIQTTTCSSACAVVDLLREGRIPSSGMVRQEQIPLEAFLANRFGSVYDPARNH